LYSKVFLERPYLLGFTIALCCEQEKVLALYNFDGSSEREWTMDSLIRYIKV